MIKYKNMSPLIIVGILIPTALADVSHVLSGAAHPPANPREVNYLAGPKNAFQTGNPQDFWWMAANSPLKDAYDYFKRCSSKGNCLPPVNLVSGVAEGVKSVNLADDSLGPIDVKKNPFLAGVYPAGSFSFAASSSSSGCTACSTGSKAGGVAAFHSGTKIDVSNNPFLNGQFAVAGNGEKIKDENGFLGVQPRKPEFATSHPLSNKKPFATSPPIAQQSFVLGGDTIQGIECNGQGYICVAKEQCINGVVNKEDGLLQVRSNVQYCDANSQACCRLTSSAPGSISFGTVLPGASVQATLASNINDLADVSAGKSSVTGSPLKFSGGVSSAPGQIQVLIGQSPEGKPQLYHAGESGSQFSSSTVRSIQDATPSANSLFPTAADYSNVHFDSNVRFASTIKGPAYLPPVGGPPSTTPEPEQPTQPTIVTYPVPTPSHPIVTTPRLCPAGTFLTAAGICESPGTPAPLCPSGTIRKPDGSCERPTPTIPQSCPPGTFLTASGSCEVLTQPPVCPIGTIQSPDGTCVKPNPPTPRPCPPGTFLTISGSCESPTPPRPVCPLGTIQRPDGSCENLSVPTTPTPCPSGTILTDSGLCEAIKTVQICPLGTIQKPDGSCEVIRTPSTQQPCPFGTIQTLDGSCRRPGPPPTPRPCPPGTFLTNSGLCESPTTTPRPLCPPGTFLGNAGTCERPIVTTVGYEYSKPCPSGTFKTSAGLCEKPILTTLRPCPFGTYLTPFGSCETSTPKPTPRPFETTTSREYLPPVTPTQYVPTVTKKPHQPLITPEQPFQPSVTPQKPQVTPPKPYQPFVTPAKPFQPSTTPQIPLITTQKPYYPSVTTPRPYQPLVTTQRPYQPFTVRPTPSLTIPTSFSPSKASCEPGQIFDSSESKCVYPPLTTPAPIKCAPGKNLTSSGTCEYPTKGYEYPTSTTSKSEFSCGPGKVLSPSGSCIYSSHTTLKPEVSSKPLCGFGQILSSSGACIYTSPPSILKPSCGPGQIISSSGIGCEYPKTPRPTLPSFTVRPSASCPFGTKLSPITHECIIKTTGYEYPKPTPSLPESTGPLCKPDQIFTSSGCIYPIQTTGPKPSCPVGQRPSPSGFGCEYPPKTPKPVTSRPPILCPFGAKLSPVTNECIASYPGSTTVSPISHEQPPAGQISCGPGRILSTSGSCVYPSQQISTTGYNYSTPFVPRPSTVRPTTIKECFPGQTLSSSRSCVYPHGSTPIPLPSSKPSCGPGQILSPTGSCIYLSHSTSRPPPTAQPPCSAGQVLSPSGSCTYSLEQTPKPPIEGLIPSCAPGQIVSPSGNCIYPSPPSPTLLVTPKPSCEPGKGLSSDLCIYSTIKPPSTSCKPDQILSPTGSCVYPYPVPSPAPRPSCGPDQILSSSGFCFTPSKSTSSPPTEYEYQTSSYTNTSTIRPTIVKQCAPGQILSSSGFCIYPLDITSASSSSPSPLCEPGQILSPEGSCIYSPHSTARPQLTSKPVCGPGQILSSGSCIYPLRPSSKPQTEGPILYSPTPRPPSSSKPSCKAGQILSSSGSCIYTSYPNPSTGYKYPKPSTSFTPGYPGTTPISSSKQCADGQILSPSGVCIYSLEPTPSLTPLCGQGQILSTSGSCIYPSHPPPKPPSVPKPSCEPGKILSLSGLCIYPSQLTATPPTDSSTQPAFPKPSCGPEQVLSPSGVCIYVSGSLARPPSGSPTSSCGPGQILSSSGSCTYGSPPTSKPPISKPSCGLGQELSPSGSCVYPPQLTSETSTESSPLFCAPGQILSSSGACIYPSRPTSRPPPIAELSCAPGQVLSSSGLCIYSSQPTTRPPAGGSSLSCGSGQILSSSGSCIYPSSPTPKPPHIPKPSCEAGQILSLSGSCIYPLQSTSKPPIERPTITCGPNQILSSSGICIYPSQPTPRPPPIQEPSCGPGQLLSPSGSCIYQSQSTPRPSTGGATPSCEPGQIRSSSGSCIYPLRPPTSSSNLKPFCRPGQVPSLSGSCIYPSQSTSKPPTGYEYPTPPILFTPNYTESSTIIPTTHTECAPGQILSSGFCIYPLEPKPSTSPLCKIGQILSPSGSCVYPSRPTPRPSPTLKPSCGPGEILSPSGYCTQPSQPTAIPPKGSPLPSCEQGQVISPSGSCIYPSHPRPPFSLEPSCKPGQILSPSGLCIYPSKPIPIPPPSYEYPTPATSLTPAHPVFSTIKPSTFKPCAPGQILSSSGSCIYSAESTPSPPSAPCGTGQILSSSGSCIYASPPGSSPQPNVKPSCTSGQILSPSGLCIDSSQATLEPPYSSSSTGDGYPKPSTSLIPSYSGPSTARPVTSKQCGPGQIEYSSGLCIYPQQTTSKPTTSFIPTYTGSSTSRQCTFGQILSSTGSCIYPSQSTSKPVPSPTIGYEYPRPTTFVPNYPAPSTVKPPASKQCLPGQVLSPSGSCIYISGSTSSSLPVCESGQVLSSSGSCVYPTSPTFTSFPSPKPSRKPLCRPGQILSSSGNCIYSSQPTLGTTLKPLTSKQCPPGAKPSAFGSGCEYPRHTTPKPSIESYTGYQYPKPSTPFETKPQCPFGTRLGPSGSCERSSVPTTTPIYENFPTSISSHYPSPCPSGTIKISSGECKSIGIPPQKEITCPPGSALSASGKCLYPTPVPTIPGRPIDTNNQFTPSYPSKKPYRPTSTPSPTDGYIYYTPTSYLPPSPSTPETTGSSIKGESLPPPYTPPEFTLPPPSDITGQSGNQVPVRIRPTTPGTEPGPPVGCAAALKCVQEIYCTVEGFVSPVPVVLTKEQELLRAPTTECRDLETGIIGKCCRDLNYKDPWPSANLVNGVDDGQYKEDNFYGQHELLGNRLTRASNTTTSGSSRPGRNVAASSDVQSSQPVCGERHYNTKPLAPGPLDANFAEYPWQAMILRDSNRSLLCGGAIIRRNAVLTAAHCVEGLETSDVLIKGGEWKLGIDEEPLPFQIVKVGAILRHPGYKAGFYENDIAVLILREQLRPSKNVGMICLPQPNQAPTSKCVATGWGKRILQLHAKGAIMHHINVDILDGQRCQQTLEESFKDSIQNYSPNTLCGVSNIDQCKVDYGSALACSNDEQQYTLTGIYSWDTGCKQEGQIGGYVTPDVEWIESILGKSIKELKRIEREYLLKSSSN